MIGKIQKTHNRWLLWSIFVTSAALTFILHATFFSDYASAPVVPGYDTIGHVQLGKYYAEHIFPSVWGWAPEWLAGMPFPQFYPPLFYMAMALLWKILPFASYEIIFKIFVILLTLSIPALIAAVASRVVRRSASVWIAGLAAALLLSTAFGAYDNLGVSLVSTFTVGLVTQLIGFVFLLAWLWALLGSAYSKTSYYLSIIFLALIALSSVHVISVAILMYGVNMVIQEFECLRNPRRCFSSSEWRRTFVRMHVVPALLALLFTSFWLVPMIFVYGFMPAQSLGVADGIGARNLWVILVRWWVPLVFLITSSVVLWWRGTKARWFIVVSSIIVLAPSALRLDAFFPGAPLHVYRFLPFFYFAGALTASITYDALASRITKKWVRALCVIGVLILFAVPWFNSRGALTRNGFYDAYFEDRADDIARYLKGAQGMYSVEVTNSGRPLNSIIADEAGPSLRSNYAVFAESSLNSLFYIPLRSEFSAYPETLSVRSLLSDSSFLKTKDPEAMAGRARRLGVNYFLARSGAAKKILSNSSDFKEEKDFGYWTLYRLAGGAPAYAEIPSHEPVVIFAPLGIKGKVVGGLPYVYFQERILLNGHKDLTLVWSENNRLDDTFSLDRFKAAVISSYEYRSQTKALENLTAYAKSNKLILVSSPDPLYKALKSALRDNRNVHFIEAAKDVSFTADAILTWLDDEKVPLGFKTSVSASTTAASIKITLDSPVPHELPVIVKSTYFPAWRAKGGKPVYMATPAFTLIYTKDFAEINFAEPRTVVIGQILTLLAAGIFTILLIGDIRRRR